MFWVALLKSLKITFLYIVRLIKLKIDINHYKNQPYELQDAQLKLMSIQDAAELIKYIEAIAAVRSDELKIHSNNIMKVIGYLRSTGLIKEN